MIVFNRWLTIILIGLGALLIQAHAVPYWTMRIGHTGSHLLPWNGWGWSLLLLLVEIALWPRKGWVSRLGAVVVTLLIAAGPLYTTTKPLLDSMATVSVQAETPRIKDARRAVEDNRGLVEKYNADWRLRKNLPGAQVALSLSQTKLDGLLARAEVQAVAGRMVWRTVVEAWAQVLLILIATLTVPLGLISLSGVRPVRTDNEKQRKDLIYEYGVRTGAVSGTGKVTVRSVAKQLEVPASSLSDFSNYKTSDKASKKMIKKLTAKRSLFT